jgi:hypothetical protein
LNETPVLAGILKDVRASQFSLLSLHEQGMAMERNGLAAD